jgi:hypothetical protein
MLAALVPVVVACASVSRSTPTARPTPPARPTPVAPVAPSETAVASASSPEARSAEETVDEADLLDEHGGDDPVDEAPTAAEAVPSPNLACAPQSPLPFLIRSAYSPVSAKKQAFERALRYRTETYGHVKGFGDPAWNPTAAKAHAVKVELFGLSVTVHSKIVPALRCVEAEIKATCGATPYTPVVLAGLRGHNTFRAGEVTNHMFGIAVDVDPLRNSCCGCVAKWKASPLCKKKAASIWERMEMPRCWVDAFEKYGFYWLGRDVLQDTMHFEFLGDPDRVSAPKTLLAGDAPPGPPSEPSNAEQSEPVAAPSPKVAKPAAKAGGKEAAAPKAGKDTAKAKAKPAGKKPKAPAKKKPKT